MKIRLAFVVLFLATFIGGPVNPAGAQNPAAQSQGSSVAITASEQEIKSTLDAFAARVQEEAKDTLPFDALFPPGAGINKVTVTGGTLTIDFKPHMTDRPWTPQSKRELESAIRQALGNKLPAGAQLKLTVRGADFDTYMTTPQQIRQRQEERTAPAKALADPVVQYPDNPSPLPKKGLYDRNLVIGPSHGWYYSDTDMRWQYQRCRLFTIVEDLYPMSYTNPFLIPMLENAGATVFTMRERDFQTAEVIVDNDKDGNLAGSDFVTSGTWTTGSAKGWKGGVPRPLTETEEPFTLGTTLEAPTGNGTDASAAYVPFFPKDGQYAVYASWASSPLNSPAVPITIHHLGGNTTVLVNQQVAGNTWVFLGFFDFAKGKNAPKGSVDVDTKGAKPSAEAQKEGKSTMVSIDAIRFGGGMGDIEADGHVSGHPRYAECCRYWAQYAGGPNDLVIYQNMRPFGSGRDYNRDIIARPEWTNYINGAPDGPNADRSAPGLGIPVDLSLSWHTDAGIKQDGLIGTLAVYRIRGQDGNSQFPDGRPRTLNRDLATLIQNEVCRSVRSLYTSQWARRQLHDGNYGEARRPNMPTALLELLSHQNFNDMKYGNDPRFKRDVSRAIYKAMLRFIADSNGFDPVVTPLEPTNLVARHLGGGKVMLSWRAQNDPLEPTAKPDGYIVYESSDGIAFGNGRYVTEPQALISGVPQGQTRYFRVAAANAGGKSFPSRVVAVRWVAGKKPILLVDDFDRICGPAAIDQPGSRGFSRAVDPGVGYMYNYGLTGDQYDYDPKSPFLTNDQPGWGASKKDWEDRLERGNQFNNVVPHAECLEKADVAFDSATADAWSDGDVQDTYQIIDWIAGRQRTTPPPKGITGVGKPDRMKTAFVVFDANARKRLENHMSRGGGLILSGAYVIEDLTKGPAANDDSRRFARDILGVEGYASRATHTNSVRKSDAPGTFKGVESFRFGRDLEQTVYPVESAESLVPVSPSAESAVLQYGDTGQTAALAGKKVVVMGFPIETVLPVKTRTALLEASLAELQPAQ